MGEETVRKGMEKERRGRGREDTSFLLRFFLGEGDLIGSANSKINKENSYKEKKKKSNSMAQTLSAFR